MDDPAKSRREEALDLADELLGDIEYVRLSPSEIARKCSRLARLLDDQDAMNWLHFEIAGYPTGSGLPQDAWSAAKKSNRVYDGKDGDPLATTTSLGHLQTNIDGALAQIAAATDASVSVTSANPYQHVVPPQGNTRERGAVRNFAGEQKALLDKVIGAIHAYATARYQGLRFGSAVETAFETVRERVDARIATLVPDAPAMLAAAFENAASENPEHWASAAATCRRLLKAAADVLRPPGGPVDGHPMTDSHYRNRLIDWVVNQTSSETTAALVKADIEHLGARLEAVDEAGHKGAHANVSHFEAARFLAATYLLLGDVLDLSDDQKAGGEVSAEEEAVGGDEGGPGDPGGSTDEAAPVRSEDQPPASDS